MRPDNSAGQRSSLRSYVAAIEASSCDWTFFSEWATKARSCRKFGDEEEKAPYGASILRKLRDLTELNRSYRDEKLCSYYLGCLANEKRADLPWGRFRDEVAQYFAEEILSGKIARHGIDHHYKGMWVDLVAAAEQARARRKRDVVSQVATCEPQFTGSSGSRRNG